MFPNISVGEIFSPACESCKDSDSSWSPEDLFSSHIMSVIGHFNQKLCLIVCLFLNPGDTFITAEEVIEMTRAEI